MYQEVFFWFVVVATLSNKEMLKEGKTLGVISDLSADMEGHISLPTWTKIVPHYTRKDVLTLIGLMGITKDNYTKGRSVVYKAI